MLYTKSYGNIWSMWTNVIMQLLNALAADWSMLIKFNVGYVSNLITKIPIITKLGSNEGKDTKLKQEWDS